MENNYHKIFEDAFHEEMNGIVDSIPESKEDDTQVESLDEAVLILESMVDKFVESIKHDKLTNTLAKTLLSGQFDLADDALDEALELQRKEKLLQIEALSLVINHINAAQ